eukprot:6812935-Pyramimonas_sp.AAC.1
MHGAASELRTITAELDLPFTDACICGGAPQPCISIVAVDADQAHEQCSAHFVGQAWAEVSRAIVKQLGADSALLRRGRQCITKNYPGGTPPNYFKIS